MALSENLIRQHGSSLVYIGNMAAQALTGVSGNMGAHWYVWYVGNMGAQAVQVLRALEALMPDGQLEAQGRLEACVVNMQGMQSQYEQQQQGACKQLEQIRVKVSRSRNAAEWPLIAVPLNAVPLIDVAGGVSTAAAN